MTEPEYFHKYLIKKFSPPYFKDMYHGCSRNILISAIVIQPVEIIDNGNISCGCMILYYGVDNYQTKPNSFLFESFYCSLDEAYEDMLNDFGLSQDDFVYMVENEINQFEYLNNDRTKPTTPRTH